MKDQIQAKVLVEILSASKANLEERQASIIGLQEYIESRELTLEAAAVNKKLNQVTEQIERLTARFPELKGEVYERQVEILSFDFNHDGEPLALDNQYLRAA